MADFARWVTACESALPWKPGVFIAAYRANIDAGNSAAVEGSAVASAILALLEATPSGEFVGSLSQLLDELEAVAGEKAVKAKTWPTSPRALSGSLERCLPNLRRAGVAIEDLGKSGPTRARQIHIFRPTNGEKDAPDAPDAPPAAKINGFNPGASPEHCKPVEEDAPPDAPAKNYQKSAFFDRPELLERPEHLSGAFSDKKTINSALPQQSPLKSTEITSKQPEIRPIQPVGSNGLFSVPKTPDSDPVVVISNDGEGITL